MRVLVLLVLASGCGGGVCGTAEYTLLYGGGQAAEMWDRDDNGSADLVEGCGTTSGSFGLRRYDYGITELVFDPKPYGNDFQEALEVSTYLLPAANIVFLTDHLEAGAVLDMDNLAGGGLHHLGGTAEELYATYGLLDAEITVVEGPRAGRGVVAESIAAERWKVAWRVEYGDLANNMVLQTWDAEDWIEVSDGTEVGTPTFLPPDFPTAR